ncbi:GntR family transcriptional regulator [Thermocatellispora tengchongensis]|uniref:GntR family transcriptional regulator n=1 Tax=Thermocatellispora tengchongensis TaxID=1073253 RepID=A0A840NY24_9ACTN|nr:GntR family transcriptional regulator [Thermocatellispora tengchongensis]MBB5130561.1 GntR family transcriptional regulator [Thermocatellispora tengchongensis]
MEINRRSYVPLHIQLADILRRRIRAGDLAAGSTLPTEHQLATTYGISRDSVRKALAVLRSEGVVMTTRGEGTRVRAVPERRRIALGPGDEVVIRMPTPEERAEIGIDEGVPLAVISRPGEPDEIVPADEVKFTGGGAPQ